MDKRRVTNILLKYPAMKHAKVVNNSLVVSGCFKLNYLLQLKQEFRSILKLEGTLTSLLENWGSWKERIIRYARVESTNRKVVTELLECYDAPNTNDGRLTVCNSFPSTMK